jgi:hypothetical protein
VKSVVQRDNCVDIVLYIFAYCVDGHGKERCDAVMTNQMFSHWFTTLLSTRMWPLTRLQQEHSLTFLGISCLIKIASKSMNTAQHSAPHLSRHTPIKNPLLCLVQAVIYLCVHLLHAGIHLACDLLQEVIDVLPQLLPNRHPGKQISLLSHVADSSCHHDSFPLAPHSLLEELGASALCAWQPKPNLTSQTGG